MKNTTGRAEEETSGRKFEIIRHQTILVNRSTVGTKEIDIIRITIITVSYTHLDVYKRQLLTQFLIQLGSGYPARDSGKMMRRATSKKRAAEAEKELDMDNKEATPVEDVEKILERVEHKQPAPPEKQPEVPTQTGDVDVPEKEKEKSKTMEEKVMEMFLQLSKKMDSTEENLQKKMDSTKEDNNKRLEDLKKNMEENSKKMEKKIDCLLYTSRCV